MKLLKGILIISLLILMATGICVAAMGDLFSVGKNDEFRILNNGSVKIGIGTPTNALNRGDAYIERNLEIDGTIDCTSTVNFGNSLNVDGNIVSNGGITIEEPIYFGTNATISSEPDIIDVSGNSKGLKLKVTETNPSEIVNAQAGCVMIYSNSGNQYFMSCAGGTAWWGLTMAAGNSLP